MYLCKFFVIKFEKQYQKREMKYNLFNFFAKIYCLMKLAYIYDPKRELN